MAAQRGRVAPQGHTASRRQSQGQLRHTHKTDGHTLCPGQLWPMEHPPGGREGVPARPQGLGDLCAGTWTRRFNYHGRLLPSGLRQEGDRPLRSTAAVLSSRRWGSPGSHTHTCSCTAGAHRQGVGTSPLPDARDLNGGHTAPQRGPGRSPASSHALPDGLHWGAQLSLGGSPRKGISGASQPGR